MLPFCFTLPSFAPTLDEALRRVRALRLGDEMGQGSIGRVLQAECPITQERFAIKRVPLPAPPEQRLSVLKRAAREAAVAQALAALGPGTRPASLVRHFACLYDTSEDAVLFVMQPCRGPCLAALRLREPSRRLPEERVRPMMVHVAKALGALHSSLGVLCVDLKAENVALDPTEEDPDRVVLLDFDLCRDLPGRSCCEAAVAAATAAVAAPNAAAADPPDRIWGTPEYLSYEVLKDGAASYSPASDWWALGVLAYELLYGKPPYVGHSLEALLQRMSHFSPAFPSAAEGGPQVSFHMQQWVRSLLRHRPDQRLGIRGGAAEVLDHPALAPVPAAVVAGRRH
ncbi:hypothetical protein GPECTOR_39g430 [Gonium pectorale]|uniref:non-specific serine/threonine protein kinase n=1 Tax=Gonium pectorale TaxID=33097 RepID=A0A150GAR1_GONPE|nr:hypothetical protein GPECTOR_39g430 [Gonium pectorale]|eukprot:KXZ46936.1 hypothetical protein GPECTOR_39g430 [Gonium pectorale]